MWDSGRFVQTDSKPRAVEPKKLFLSILKIDAIYGKYALIFGTPRRVDDTQAISESNLPSQEVYLFLKQKQNTEDNRLQYTLRQWDLCSRLCFCVANKESANMISDIARPDTKTRGTHAMGHVCVKLCLFCSHCQVDQCPWKHWANLEPFYRVAFQFSNSSGTNGFELSAASHKNLPPSFFQIICPQRSWFSVSSESLHTAIPHNITMNN